MGRRKFRLGRHRKNEERKRKQQEQKQPDDISPASCIVSIPLRYYMLSNVSSLDQFSTRLSLLPLSKWALLSSKSPLIYHRLRVEEVNEGTCQLLSTVITVQEDLSWNVFVVNKLLNPSSCPLLSGIPAQFSSTSDLCTLTSVIDSSKLCSGIKEPKFLELWQHRSLTLHGSSSK